MLEKSVLVKLEITPLGVLQSKITKKEVHFTLHDMPSKEGDRNTHMHNDRIRLHVSFFK